MANSRVNTTWDDNTSEAMPVGIPNFMVLNKNANWPRLMAPP